MPDSNSSAWPLPETNRYTRAFWDACQRGVLELPACRDCGRLFFPAGPCCPHCWSGNPGVQVASGRGEVYSFAIYHHQYHPALAVPYVVALIDLAEGPRLISNVVGCAPEAVEIGMQVRVEFQREGEFTLPRFVPCAQEKEETDHG